MVPITKLLNSLKDLLPRIAEEGNYVSVVSIESLCDSLAGETKLSADYIRGVLDMLEQHWLGLGLLDRDQCKQGNWRFSSFSASLAARSMLDVLSWDRPQFQSGDQWLDSRHTETNRAHLKKIELARATFSGLARPEPIRAVQVAWGLIKLDGALLFNHRADRHRPEEANYVPVGGRLNLEDLEKVFPDSTVEERLSWQQAPNLKKINVALEETLKRELVEELQLIDTLHYEYKRVFALEPYEKLEGARANYVFTRYHIVCFSINLTEAGFRQLCQATRESKREHTEILWANFSQLSRGKHGDRRLFLDAWRKPENQKFKQQFQELPESFAAKDNFQGQIDLPFEGEPKLNFGATGKEQEAPIQFSQHQIALLQALGWHRLHGNRHPFEAKSGIELHPQGWIMLSEKFIEIRQDLNELSAILEGVGLPIIEGDNSGWFRMSVELGNLYFREELYEMEVYHPEPKSYELRLHVDSMETPLGRIPSTILVIDKLSQLLHDQVALILENKPTQSEADLVTLFKQSLTKKARPLGLRIPVRHEKGDFYTNCRTREKG